MHVLKVFSDSEFFNSDSMSTRGVINRIVYYSAGLWIFEHPVSIFRHKNHVLPVVPVDACRRAFLYIPYIVYTIHNNTSAAETSGPQKFWGHTAVANPSQNLLKIEQEHSKWGQFLSAG